MRISSLVRSLIGATVLLVLAGAPAHAEDPAKARELFQEGNTYFDVGQFDKAIDSWQRGYKEKPDPGFLYNIAQAYRLSGDPHKAIFFYKGFLRNSPKAANRDDVEQKILTLQKLIADQEKAKTAPPTGPAKQDPPPPVAAPPAAPPPPGSAPTAVTPVPVSPPPAPVVPAPETSVVATPPPAAAPSSRTMDLSVAIGADGWGKSVEGTADATFAFVLGTGYTVPGSAERSFEFRIGGLIGYTSLGESSAVPPAKWREAFWSFMVEPSIRWRMAPDRLLLTGGLGIGGIALTGLRPASAFLARDMRTVLQVNGTQGLFVIRPAFGAEVRLGDALVGLVTLAFPYSPKPQKYYYAPIARTEFLVGFGYRF